MTTGAQGINLWTAVEAYAGREAADGVEPVVALGGCELWHDERLDALVVHVSGGQLGELGNGLTLGEVEALTVQLAALQAHAAQLRAAVG